MFFQKFLLSLVILVTMTTSLPLFAQEVAFSELPDAPLPQVTNPMLASAIKHTAVQPTAHKEKEGRLEAWTYRSSQAAVLMGLYADMKSTVSVMQHPQHVRFRAKCITTVNEIVTSSVDCGYELYGSSSKYFTEGGWAVKMLKINNRNIVGVVAANVALDGAFLAGTEWLHRRNSKKYKKLAEGLNFLRAGSRIGITFHNYKYIKECEKKLLLPTATNVIWYNPK